MSQYPSLTHALAEALVDLARFVESSDDEQLDQDDAVRALEGVAAVADRMSDAQRAELRQVVEAMAAAETDPGRREFLEEFPDGFGLGEYSTSLAFRLGFEPGMVVREVGYTDDADQELHDSVDAIAGHDLFDQNYDELVDAVLIWFREDDDLTAMLEYAVDELGNRGMIWLLTPKTGRDGHVDPSRVQDAARSLGLSTEGTISVAEHWNGSRLTAGEPWPRSAAGSRFDRLLRQES
jgi:hypothetical protein